MNHDAGQRPAVRKIKKRQSVGGEKIRRRSLIVSPGLGDAIAHVVGAAGALRALAAGAKNIGGAAGARTDGGVDFAFTNGLADADEHALAPRPPCRCDLLADANIEVGPGPVKLS